MKPILHTYDPRTITYCGMLREGLTTIDNIKRLYTLPDRTFNCFIEASKVYRSQQMQIELRERELEMVKRHREYMDMKEREFNNFDDSLHDLYIDKPVNHNQFEYEQE